MKVKNAYSTTNLSSDVLDEVIKAYKMVLICVLLKFFRDNIKTHVIRVSKQDLTKIKRIDFSYNNIRGINLTNLINLIHQLICPNSSI